MARKVLSNLDMQTNEVVNLGTPTLSTDGATKGYVDTAVLGAGDPLTLVKATTLLTNSSNTTPTDVTGISWSLSSGVMYHFKIMGSFRSAATTTGIGFTFSGPATTYCSWNVEMQQAAAGTDGFYQNAATALTTVLVSTATLATATDYPWEIEGFVQPSAAGTLQLRFRSEVNASQVTLNAGTLGILTTIG